MNGEPIIIEAVPVTDLVLVVGPGKERIPVESAILKAASDVFNAMLSPPWLESQGREISLPEDDADAMQFIMLTLHFHNNYEFVTRPRTSKEILQIAIAADKYNLCTALKWVLESLLKGASLTCPLNSSGELVPAGELVYLAAAAYVLDDCTSFSKFALHVMISHWWSFTTLMDDDLINSILPAKFFVILGEKVVHFKLETYRAIQKCIHKDSPYRECKCLWAGSLLERFEKFALTYSTPNEDGLVHPLSEVFDTLETFVTEDRSFLRVQCPGWGEELLHSYFIPESSALSYKVRELQSHAVVCLRELKNKGDCNARHEVLIR